MVFFLYITHVINKYRMMIFRINEMKKGKTVRK